MIAKAGQIRSFVHVFVSITSFIHSSWTPFINLNPIVLLLNASSLIAPEPSVSSELQSEICVLGIGKCVVVVGGP